MNNSMPTWPGWETVRLIGRGSFGAVYEIERDMLGETEKAALKVITIPQNENDISEMLSDGYDDESITSTFKEHLKSIVAEYSLMRKLNGSAYVVNCDDVRYVQHDDGVGWDIFIKMELLTPLPSALPADVPEEQVVKIAKDICRALVQCKQFGIIHRDIKPQNIFVPPLGDYKLGDFGIAKTVEKTSGGTKIGTYKYMAPEVYNNQPYGAGADIYSLGLVLYWLLNERRLPFLPLPPEKLRAGMEEDARLRRFNGEPIPAPAHGSEKLKRIVLKACAFDPKDRYQSAEEMLRDLEALSGKVAVAVVNAPVAHAETAEEDDGTGTIGVFGKSKNGATEDDATVRASKTDANDKNVNTEADDNTVGAFGRKEDQKIVQPAPASESKLEVKQKPKRKLWPVFAGIAVVAVLFIVCVQTSIFNLPITTAEDGSKSISPNTVDSIDFHYFESVMRPDIKDIKNLVFGGGGRRDLLLSDGTPRAALQLFPDYIEVINYQAMTQYCFRYQNERLNELEVFNVAQGKDSGIILRPVYEDSGYISEIVVSLSDGEIYEVCGTHSGQIDYIKNEEYNLNYFATDVVTEEDRHYSQIGFEINDSFGQITYLTFFDGRLEQLYFFDERGNGLVLVYFDYYDFNNHGLSEMPVAFVRVDVTDEIQQANGHTLAGLQYSADGSVKVVSMDTFDDDWNRISNSDSGLVSDEIVYSISADILTIFGNGAMPNFLSVSEVTWYDRRGEISAVVIQPGVTSIGSFAFYNCGMSSITIPTSVTSIGNSAFYNCKMLKSITIPSGVTSIGDKAFYECASLTSVSIPSSVTKIGEQAFENCISLSEIFFGGSQQQWQALTEIYVDNPIKPILSSAKIHYNAA